MVELEETWTEKSFYEKPLTVWLGEEGGDERNSPPLDIFTAASIGCYQRVRDIIMDDKNVCSHKNHGGWTALMYAAYYAHSDVINLLLEAGAPVHLRNNNGCNALMLAVMCGNDYGVEILIKGGSILETRDKRDWTALFHAVNTSHHSLNGPSLRDGPAAVEARRTHQQPQTLRGRGSAIPSVNDANVQPTDLETLLDQIGLSSYISVFREQVVDLQIFLTLTDQELKECGIQKLGPRRKMTSAIARWHSNAPLRSTVECAYADKLEVEMQELGVKLTEASQTIQQTKTQVSQENDLRVVTEGWVVEARGRLHECHQRCQVLMEQVTALRHCTSALSAQPSLVQSPLMQSTLISTIVDSLTLIAAQVDTLLALTDPSVPRGPSNPSSPRKQGYGSHLGTPRL
ncbi:Ankyrin repeat and SAM domain-containing protein 3-like [Homarus americanus]|uniref:Ankyrin repeat and SAM domain-containing protein 3-like n=1 Tax=Homarus americanus TaxID=6706 RepID=A0A8J5JKQ2_HOMAM|nr:Ankyrin repeat and SAM domain-containing protein 3-like [Homarus americanus]